MFVNKFTKFRANMDSLSSGLKNTCTHSATPYCKVMSLSIFLFVLLSI